MFVSRLIFATLAALSWTTTVVNACAGCSPAVYTATITELNGSGVSGSVVVFAGSGVTGSDANQDEVDTVIGYGGFVTGLEPGLEALTCNATNGEFITGWTIQ